LHEHTPTTSLRHHSFCKVVPLLMLLAVLKVSPILIPTHVSVFKLHVTFIPLNTKLNPICHLLGLLGAHHFLHVSRIRVKACPCMAVFMTKYYCIQRSWYLEIQGPAEIPHDLVIAVSGTLGVGNLSLSALLARLKAFQLPWSAGL